MDETTTNTTIHRDVQAELLEDISEKLTTLNNLLALLLSQQK